MRAATLGCVLLIGAPLSASELRRSPIVLAIEKVAPAVVNIATEQLVARREDPRSPNDPLNEEFFRDFGEPRLDERSPLASLGSGTIIDPRGYVLTNEHVIRRASQIRVILADKREFEASVVGTDPGTDLAVLLVRAPVQLPFASLGTSSDLMVGETLIAIGNPFGLSHSVTTGVLSARSRSVRVGERHFGDFLQTDAAINPGNSGGPLLNVEGGIVGIATAIYSGGSGIGFAIPVDRARRVVDAIVSHGSATPFWIGVQTKVAGEGIRHALGVGGGLVVTSVVAGGPAAAGGLVRGDVLVSAAGQNLGSSADLDAVFARGNSTSGTRIELVRDGKPLTLAVHPLRASSEQLLTVANSVLGFSVGRREAGETGLVVRALRPGCEAEVRGFRSGDVLHEMDGVRLDGLDAFRSAFYKALLRGNTMMLVQHGDAMMYVPLALE